MSTSPRVVDKDHGWKKIFAAIEAARGKRVAHVGVLADSDKGGMHEPGGELTVAEIAAIMEFGTEDGRIPSRSFIRSTFDEKREEMVTMARDLLGKVLIGTITAETALNALGAWFSAELKKKITEGPGVQPPDAPATALAKANKGKTAHLMSKKAENIGDALAQAGAVAAVRALVDSSRMVAAITWALVTSEK